ncbi:hypothetical protein CDD81_1439 [Ophiocordyceps australis]|uniref:Uncharacterized protein n=1 Tax=Ophiocordyceps australis TaxID=1399860 RepID=A0A2C5XYW3_9HYPO|nr:hypothetical protein CDD81_1439 [Ophiocordyceps australis]
MGPVLMDVWLSKTGSCVLPLTEMEGNCVLLDKIGESICQVMTMRATMRLIVQNSTDRRLASFSPEACSFTPS